MDAINEKSTSVQPITFTDEDGDAVTPDTATWRLHDLNSNVNLQTATALASLASSMEITIGSTENRILNGDHVSEVKELTINFTFGTGKQGTNKVRYKVNNLSFFS